MGCAASSEEASEEELQMRKAVMAAAREDDMAGVRKAIDAIKEKFNDPEKTASACSMWDPKEDAFLFMMALKWAAKHGNAEMCQFLIDNGAEVDVYLYAKPPRGKFSSPGGVPALAMAAAAGHMEAVKCLVRAGADPSYVNCMCQNAADMAGMGGHPEVQQYLMSVMSAGAK